MKLDQVVTALLAVVGWFVLYLAAVRRDRLQKQRDLRTQYLLDAYR